MLEAFGVEQVHLAVGELALPGEFDRTAARNDGVKGNLYCPSQVSTLTIFTVISRPFGAM
jgi:hypothetical protein